jgi:hypothetical protein
VPCQYRRTSKSKTIVEPHIALGLPPTPRFSQGKKN